MDVQALWLAIDAEENAEDDTERITLTQQSSLWELL